MKDQFFYLRLLGPLIYETIRKYRRWIFGCCLSRYEVLRENENMWGETNANFWAKKMWFFYISQQKLIYHGSIFLWASAYSEKLIQDWSIFALRWIKRHFAESEISLSVCVSPLSISLFPQCTFSFREIFRSFWILASSLLEIEIV